jgi:hypothetical protein
MSKRQVVLNVIYHRQNLLEFNSWTFLVKSLFLALVISFHFFLCFIISPSLLT